MISLTYLVQWYLKGETKMMYEQMNQQTYPQMQPMGGMYYNGFQGQPTPVQKINNILSPEQIDKLTSSSVFDIGITEEDYAKAICNHRSKDGTSDTLVFDPVTGVARCTICGYEFRPIDSSESVDDIKAAVDKIIDIMQTIKILYVDLPPQAHKDIFPMLATLQKIPKLFEIASKNFSKHETFNWQYSRYNMNGVQMLANLSSMFGGGNGMYSQPYNPQMQQPMQPQMGGWGQQPMMNNGWGAPQQPQQPMGNPFGYPGANQQPQMMGNPYQPQQYQGFVPQPQQATTPATPTVEPSASAEKAEVKKEITI